MRNLCQGHHVFDGTPSFLCHFLLLSSSINVHNIAMGDILLQSNAISCKLVLADWHLEERDVILGFVLALVALVIMTLYLKRATH